MKVFISWSGQRSRAVAEALREWLPRVIQAVDPWVSLDIEKGARWGPEIAKELENSSVGIICLTPENRDARWILFEAGALSKSNASYVCTYLLSIEAADVEPPLGQFQHTKADREDTRRLLQTINAAVEKRGEKSLTAADLAEAFEVWWPKLEAKLRAVAETVVEQVVSTRPEREILEELLELTRGLREEARTAAAAQRAIAVRQVRDSETPRMLNYFAKIARSPADTSVDERMADLLNTWHHIAAESKQSEMMSAAELERLRRRIEKLKEGASDLPDDE